MFSHSLSQLDIFWVCKSYVRKLWHGHGRCPGHATRKPIQLCWCRGASAHICQLGLRAATAYTSAGSHHQHIMDSSFWGLSWPVTAIETCHCICNFTVNLIPQLPAIELWVLLRGFWNGLSWLKGSTRWVRWMMWKKMSSAVCIFPMSAPVKNENRCFRWTQRWTASRSSDWRTILCSLRLNPSWGGGEGGRRRRGAPACHRPPML